MPALDPRYTEDQRAALERSQVELPGVTAPEIAKRAERGELTLDGTALEPFDVPVATIRTLQGRYRRRMDRDARGALADASPRDQLELVRRELVIICSREVKKMDRQQRRRNGKPIDPERLRQVARAAREIAAIPGPDGRPAPARKPGSHIPGTRDTDGGATSGGLAGAAIAALKPPGVAVHGDPSQHLTPGETTAPTATTSSDDPGINGEDAGDPGSFARAQLASAYGSGDGAPT